MKFRFITGVIICSVLLILSLGLPIFERSYFLKTNTDPMNFRFEDRAQIWQVSLAAGSRSPFFGTGIESVQNRIAAMSKKLNANIQYQTVDSAHNIFLDFWIWGGGTGLVLLICLVILTLWNLTRKKMVIETAVMIGLLAVLSFNPTTVSVLAAFWWIIGRSFARET
jgi:O-antigen ligase